mmetsp:Transcript_26884/g.86353  ORF Transcript_26884/g.86353 Transcript_26884/m.86353 type:complete len:512 (-) Transcript_26884:1336-2871(-)
MRCATRPSSPAARSTHSATPSSTRSLEESYSRTCSTPGHPTPSTCAPSTARRLMTPLETRSSRLQRQSYPPAAPPCPPSPLWRALLQPHRRAACLPAESSARPVRCHRACPRSSRWRTTLCSSTRRRRSGRPFRRSTRRSCSTRRSTSRWRCSRRTTSSSTGCSPRSMRRPCRTWRRCWRMARSRGRCRPRRCWRAGSTRTWTTTCSSTRRTGGGCPQTTSSTTHSSATSPRSWRWRCTRWPRSRSSRSAAPSSPPSPSWRPSEAPLRSPARGASTGPWTLSPLSPRLRPRSPLPLSRREWLHRAVGLSSLRKRRTSGSPRLRVAPAAWRCHEASARASPISQTTRHWRTAAPTCRRCRWRGAYQPRQLSHSWLLGLRAMRRLGERGTAAPRLQCLCSRPSCRRRSRCRSPQPMPARGCPRRSGARGPRRAPSRSSTTPSRERGPRSLRSRRATLRSRGPGCSSASWRRWWTPLGTAARTASWTRTKTRQTTRPRRASSRTGRRRSASSST